MPKTLQEFFYKFSKDTVWEFGKYIGLFLIGSGGYLMKGWITAVFFTAGTFFSLAYIKNLFDKNFGVKVNVWRIAYSLRSVKMLRLAKELSSHVIGLFS